MAHMNDRLSAEGLRHASVVRREGSFSGAARVLGLSQPALSHSVARLEAALGEKLFTRSTRGTGLTPAGRELLPLIDDAVAALDAVGAAAQRRRESTVPTLRVGVSPLISPALVARVRAAATKLGDARDDGPGDLILREADLTDLRRLVDAGELDLALVPAVLPADRYRHRLITFEPVVLVEASATPAAKPATDSSLAAAPAGSADCARVRELTDVDLILVPDTCGLTTFTRGLFADRGLAMRTFAGEAASYHVLEEWARMGVGSAILPLSRLSDPQAPHRTLMDEQGRAVTISYEAIWDPASAAAPRLTKLVDLLVADAPRPSSPRPALMTCRNRH
ncbi:LysR family transcriptional regulator [Actinomyces sp. MRS3W]|uniref:LysR family transcriptional regulator n=1 Tax=Actinomyces sp. MRS3W TaxID=2800796 RepID=UPI0028FDC38B|nr:LysR family transcriptional regulator [Actinomyces sp. MRS3W]MDU0349687.1 LysR family transcriptional regulator [Actinomyces sp. MRS3W]